MQRVMEQAGRDGQAVEIDADGHATALRELGTMVLVADCLPVILGSEGAVAAVHAGWRGLAGGVLEEGMRAVRELGGSGEIVAIIGPGARGCCYEVGEEVHLPWRPFARGRRDRLLSASRVPPSPGRGAHREGRATSTSRQSPAIAWRLPG